MVYGEKCMSSFMYAAIFAAESGIGFCVDNIKNDYKDISFTHYTVNDGLVHSVVQAFIEDDEGNIWVSTEYGISCFNPENKIFNNYFFSNDILATQNPIPDSAIHILPFLSCIIDFISLLFRAWLSRLYW